MSAEALIMKIIKLFLDNRRTNKIKQEEILLRGAEAKYEESERIYDNYYSSYEENAITNNLIEKMIQSKETISMCKTLLEQLRFEDVIKNVKVKELKKGGTE